MGNSNEGMTQEEDIWNPDLLGHLDLNYEEKVELAKKLNSIERRINHLLTLLYSDQQDAEDSSDIYTFGETFTIQGGINSLNNQRIQEIRKAKEDAVEESKKKRTEINEQTSVNENKS